MKTDPLNIPEQSVIVCTMDHLRDVRTDDLTHRLYSSPGADIDRVQGAGTVRLRDGTELYRCQLAALTTSVGDVPV